MTRDSLEPAARDGALTPLGEADGDLATTLTGKIVGVVDKLNRVSARPLVTQARALVFGLLGLVLVFTALVLLTIGALRALDVYLPEDVWAAHLALGAIFTLTGLFVWSKRKPAKSQRQR